MKSKLLIFVMLFALSYGNTYSQELSKDEKKALKKELKGLIKDPAKYKKQKESRAVKESIIKEQTEEILSITTEKTKYKNQLALVQDSVSYFSGLVAKMEKEKTEVPVKVDLSDDKGMKYRLQIGKYKEFDITSFLNDKKLLTFEKLEDGTFIYNIGNFATEYDAELFKSAMRQIGIRDAFVSYYLDGQRIPKE